MYPTLEPIIQMYSEKKKVEVGLNMEKEHLIGGFVFILNFISKLILALC